MKTTRLITALLTAAAFTALPVGPADALPLAAPVVAPQAVPATVATPDFDGDGKVDLATAFMTPSEDRWIKVRFGSGTTTVIKAPVIGDDWNSVGTPMLAKDLNADGYTDLAFVRVGPRPGADLCRLSGSPSGLQDRSLACSGIPGIGSTHRATSMALVDDPAPRLVVGAVSKNAKRAGLLVGYRLVGGVPTGTPQVVRPGSGKVPSISDAGSFGQALTSAGTVLFVGAPDSKVGSVKGAGAVVSLTFSAEGVASGKVFSQRTKGVAGSVAKGDRFGFSLDARDRVLIVGTPGDRIGRASSSGSVQVFTLASGKVKPRKLLSQASAGVPGKAEKGDDFGQAVALGTVCSGVTGVVVGGPGETITKGHQFDGSAWIIPLQASKNCRALQLWEGHGLGGTPTYGRFLGEQVAVIREKGDSADRIVVAGEGLYSDLSPLGVLAVWSGQTRQSVLYVVESTRGLAGR